MSRPLVVRTETQVRDIEKAVAFYDAVLGTKTSIDRSGPQPTASLGDAMDTVGCTLFEGAPGPASVTHFAVPALEAAVGRVAGAGGRVEGDPVAIPVRGFVYVTDPDGNRLGLFEARG